MTIFSANCDFLVSNPLASGDRRELRCSVLNRRAFGSAGSALLGVFLARARQASPLRTLLACRTRSESWAPRARSGGSRSSCCASAVTTTSARSRPPAPPAAASASSRSRRRRRKRSAPGELDVLPLLGRHVGEPRARPSGGRGGRALRRQVGGVPAHGRHPARRAGGERRPRRRARGDRREPELLLDPAHASCSPRSTPPPGSAACASRPTSPPRARASQSMERLRGEQPDEHDLRMDWDFDGVEFEEESKIRAETRKILELPELPVSATCVRVPVLVGHAEAVWIETETPLSSEDAERVLGAAPGRPARPVPDPGQVGRRRRGPGRPHPRGRRPWRTASRSSSPATTCARARP